MGKDVDLLIGGVLVEMQPSTVGHVSILELEVDSICRSSFQSFCGQVDSVLLELDFFFCNLLVIDCNVRDFLSLEV